MNEGETVVIGAGLGGLAVAALLARGGRRVRVLEKATHPGGRAQSQVEACEGGAFTFNLGPHALYRGGAAERVLEELGVPTAGGVPKATGALALAGGRTFMLPAGPFSLLATGLLPVGAKFELGRLLASLPGLDAGSLAGRSVTAWLDESRWSAPTRVFVEALVRVSSYTHAPDVLDASVAVSQLQRVTAHGVLYLDGGWQRLVDGLREVATAAGAVIETAAKVTRIACQGGAARAIEVSDGRCFPAEAVVVAASPAVASALFPSDAALSRAAGGAVPIEAACLDVGLSSLPRPRTGFVLGIDEPVYASVHSSVAALAPPGRALVQIARYLAPGEASPAEADLLAVLDILQPGASTRIMASRYLPRLTVMHDIARAAPGGLAARPSGLVEGVANVALVGDWVGPEGLLADAVFASARAAFEALLAAPRVQAAA